MLTRLLVLCRLLVLFIPIQLALTTAPTPAYAGDDDDDDEEEGDDEGGGDGDEEKDEQPPVTAGGLFTKKTYPIPEIDRTLTVIGGMLEARVGFGIDMSKGSTFKTWDGLLDARYGLKDNLELQAGAKFGLVEPEGIDAPVALYAGVEAAIAYDLVDFRVLAEIPVSPTFLFDIAIGFPFRYRVKPNIAIIALDKLFTVHTTAPAEGADVPKPDLTVGIGVVFQAAPPLAVLARGEVIIPGFESDAITIPATIGAQFSPNNKVDIGLEASLANVKASEGRFDRRALVLYLQFRP